MNEVRIKLNDHIAKQWAAAAKLRGLALTSFVVATVSEALLRNGELSADPHAKKLEQPQQTTKRVIPVEEWDEVDEDGNIILQDDGPPDMAEINRNLVAKLKEWGEL